MNYLINQGLRHPVPKWREVSEEEFAGYSAKKRREYLAKKSEHERDQRRYDELVAEWKQNPLQWFRMNPRSGGVWFCPTARVCINELWFDTPFNKEASQQFYQFPKGQWVSEALYGETFPRGFKDGDWIWRVQFGMVNGVLSVVNMRALTRSVNSIISDYDFEQQQLVFDAIAAESPNGTYVVRIREFGYHYRKEPPYERYLLIKYEIMSGQARGYQGVLFFDEKVKWSQKKLHELERALGVPKGIWSEINRNLSDPKSTGPRQLESKWFKARFDFKGDRVKLENPRKVDSTEVNLWL